MTVQSSKFRVQSKKAGKKKVKSKASQVREAKNLLGKAELAEALADLHRDRHGELGFILKILKERPRNFNPWILKGMAIYKEPSSLDRKTAELVALGASA
ncbi:MAG TPA: hypothetical protein VLG39_04255, partial [Nitrospirota bacterium]|nr:hypothetical protein [Nitrospirota bacterium]